MQLHSVTELTSGETSRREPRFLIQSSAQSQTSNVSVTWEVTVLIVVLVVDVLVVVIKYSVRRGGKSIEEFDSLLYDIVVVRNTDDRSLGGEMNAMASFLVAAMSMHFCAFAVESMSLDIAGPMRM